MMVTVSATVLPRSWASRLSSSCFLRSLKGFKHAETPPINTRTRCFEILGRSATTSPYRPKSRGGH
jgi:hypothetical protein